MNEAAPTHETPPSPVPTYRDRSTSLMVFGVLEILLGGLCLLIVPAMVFGQIMLARQTGGSPSLQPMIPGMVFYASFAVVLIWLGIGSIQCRRWARAVLLMLSWCWLTTGILTVPMMAWLMPKVMASAPPGGPALPAGAMTMIVIIQVAFMGFFMILLPGVLVLFYRSPHVKATCEARDTVQRWTDACPLPILAVSCLLCSAAVFLLVMPLAKLGMFPFFGVLLTGLPGTLALLLMACVWFWLGVRWYRQDIMAWWTLLAVMILLAVSNVITFARVNIIEVYQKLGYSQAQLDLIQKQDLMGNSFMVWGCLLWLVPMVGYVVWTRRYFPTRSA